MPLREPLKNNFFLSEKNGERQSLLERQRKTSLEVKIKKLTNEKSEKNEKIKRFNLTDYWH